MADYDYEITKAVIEKSNAILNAQSIFANDTVSRQLDVNWVLGSFMMGKLDESTLDTIDIQNRTFSGALLTFMDSSPGGSYEINPRPQFTRYADIRVKGFAPNRADTTVMHGSDGASGGTEAISLGAGRYWYESQVETAQVIHMRFGVPEFNSMTQFFTSFYNEDAARVARTGRVNSAFFEIGNIAGTVLQVIYWPLLAAHAVGAGLRFLFKKPSSKFYYLRPEMTSYWNSVTTMVNQIGVNRGLIPWETPTEGTSGPPGKVPTVNGEAVAALYAAMPDIFSESGGIDVLHLASRAQRYRRALDKKLWENLQNAGSEEELVSGMNKQTALDVKPRKSLGDKIKDWVGTQVGKVTKDSSSDAEKSLRENTKDGVKSVNVDDWASFLGAEFDDGTAFCSFRVDYTGPVSENFSNSVVESDLASKFNSTSAQNKSAYFTFAGGNVTDAIGSVVSAAKDVVSGVLNSFSASGLMSLAGSAFVDIPKHWENSTTQMPRASYSTTLISPYGNTMSQMINLYIPLCCLLAAALPKSAGKQAYTWPYLVEYYDPGRAQSRLSMIDSISVERGVSNLGFNKSQQPLAIKVSWTMVELSNIVSMPISGGFSLNPTAGIFDDDNLYTDYMNILASLSLNQQIYSSNKLKLRLAQKMRGYQYMISKGRVAGMLHNWPIVGDLDVFFKGVDRGSSR